MEKIGMSLEQYIELHPYKFEDNIDKLYKLVDEKAKVMETQLKLALGDVHDGNILVTLTKNLNVKDLYFIDFGDVYQVKKDDGYGNTLKFFKTFVKDYLKYKKIKTKSSSRLLF